MPRSLPKPAARVGAARQEFFGPRCRRLGFCPGCHSFEQPVDEARSAAWIEGPAQVGAVGVVFAPAVGAEPQARAIFAGVGADRAASSSVLTSVGRRDSSSPVANGGSVMWRQQAPQPAQWSTRAASAALWTPGITARASLMRHPRMFSHDHGWQGGFLVKPLHAPPEGASRARRSAGLTAVPKDGRMPARSVKRGADALNQCDSLWRHAGGIARRGKRAHALTPTQRRVCVARRKVPGLVRTGEAADAHRLGS